jgi:hypothetical protein
MPPHEQDQRNGGNFYKHAITQALSYHSSQESEKTILYQLQQIGSRPAVGARLIEILTYTPQMIPAGASVT